MSPPKSASSRQLHSPSSRCIPPLAPASITTSNGDRSPIWAEGPRPPFGAPCAGPWQASSRATSSAHLSRPQRAVGRLGLRTPVARCLEPPPCREPAADAPALGPSVQARQAARRLRTPTHLLQGIPTPASWPVHPPRCFWVPGASTPPRGRERCCSSCERDDAGSQGSPGSRSERRRRTRARRWRRRRQIEPPRTLPP